MCVNYFHNKTNVANAYEIDINSELDEVDREEFYRLKKVANKKQRDTAASDAEMKAKKATAAGKDNGGDRNSGPSDMLNAGEEEDVIF